MSEIIARLQIAPFRRWAGVIVLALIGVGLIYSGLVYPPSTLLGRFAIFLLGSLVLLQAYWNLQVRSGSLTLKEDGLWVEDGPPQAGLDNIETVQVSAFSIKPSNGFAVVLRSPVRFKWVPGLYWCVGRRIGVGGATHPSQAKAMAELLSRLIMDRE
jgi:hypothetical protein